MAVGAGPGGTNQNTEERNLIGWLFPLALPHLQPLVAAAFPLPPILGGRRGPLPRLPSMAVSLLAPVALAAPRSGIRQLRSRPRSKCTGIGVDGIGRPNVGASNVRCLSGADARYSRATAAHRRPDWFVADGCRRHRTRAAAAATADPKLTFDQEAGGYTKAFLNVRLTVFLRYAQNNIARRSLNSMGALNEDPCPVYRAPVGSTQSRANYLPKSSRFSCKLWTLIPEP